MAATYASIKVTPAARDALQRAALNLSAEVGRRLSMSDAIAAAVTVAQNHPDELREYLTAPSKGDDQ